MIEISYEQIANPHFTQAIQKLYRTALSPRAAFFLRGVLLALNKHREAIRERYTVDIIEKYAVRDAAGAIVRPEGDPRGFTPVAGSESEAAQVAFGRNKATLPYRLALSDLGQMEISAADLDALAPILFLPEEGADPVGNVVPLAPRPQAPLGSA